MIQIKMRDKPYRRVGISIKGIISQRFLQALVEYEKPPFAFFVRPLYSHTDKEEK